MFKDFSKKNIINSDKDQTFTLEQLQYLHKKWSLFDDEKTGLSHEVSSFLYFVANSKNIIRVQGYKDYPAE